MKKYRNWLQTLGAPEDPVATDTTSAWSLVSLVKAIYGKISDGSFAAAITGRAESLVSLCQGAALACQQSARAAKANRVAAASSATDASANAAIAQLAAQAGSFAAGTALFGQRVKKDRIAAAASASAAAASAASITSEGIVLGVQVYS